MACSFPPSSAARLQAVDAAATAGAMRSGRLPPRTAVSPAQRSPRAGCKAAAARQEGATQDPAVSVSSTRTQLDLLEQLTSPTSDGIGLENGAPTEPRVRTTIREQLSTLMGDRGGEFTLPLGKKLKEGLKSLNSLTVSQRRNIKRQALLTKGKMKRLTGLGDLHGARGRKATSRCYMEVQLTSPCHLSYSGSLTSLSGGSMHISVAPNCLVWELQGFYL